ncbi:MAG: LytTR family transcriptional regulator [Bacteroidales bacterium]|nr:LytTR family transcriptional regulator [Bacteroidales bacterium]
MTHNEDLQFSTNIVVLAVKDNDAICKIQRFVGENHLEAETPDTKAIEQVLNSRVPEFCILQGNDGINPIVPIDNIVYIEAGRSYCNIHVLKDGAEKVYMQSCPLKHIEAILKDRGFARIHRSYLVNMRHVHGISGRCVTLPVKQSSIPIGRDYASRFLNGLIILGKRQHSSR